jgi:bifunctional non-homologous end joining protein LigD
MIIPACSIAGRVVIDGYTEPEGARKYFGALLVGFYEGKSFKFAGRVGTGFSDKLREKAN